MLDSDFDAFLETTTGHAFYPFNPDPDTIDIEDIVTSLNRTRRYLGHGKHTWTVLAHSYWVAKLVPDEYKLTALLHDATEAYLGDVPRPLKQTSVFAEYRKAEDRLWRVIAEKYGAHQEIPEVVHQADRALTWHEANFLMVKPLGPWWRKYEKDAALFEIPENMYAFSEHTYLARELWWQMFDRLTHSKWEKVPW